MKLPRTSSSALRSLIREISLSTPDVRSWSDVAALFGTSTYATGPEEIPSTDDTESSFSLDRAAGPLSAAVIGDSQAGGVLGATIERRLKSMGFDSVIRTYRNGAPGSVVLDTQLPNVLPESDLVVAIFGGNDGSPASAVSAANAMYDRTSQAGSYLLIVGPPPPTMITDTRAAARAFGSVIGQNPEPDAQLAREGGQYAAKRVEISQALEDSLSGRDGVSVCGIAGTIDVEDQPDGLHLVVGVDRIVDEIFSRVGMESIVESIKEAHESNMYDGRELDTGEAATAEEIASAYPAMSSYADLIVTVSDEIGIKPNWLANVINFESIGGKPTARNPISDATGLIQFMPSTARSLGTSVDELYTMSGREQMKYVRDYFMPHKNRLKTQEDVYMAVFYPVAIGKPYFEFPPNVVRDNGGIRTPQDYADRANRNARLA